MYDNRVCRFRCACGLGLYAWAGVSKGEGAMWSLAQWQSEHRKPECKITQEAGPKVSVKGRVEDILSGNAPDWLLRRV